MNREPKSTTQFKLTSLLIVVTAAAVFFTMVGPAVRELARRDGGLADLSVGVGTILIAVVVSLLIVAVCRFLPSNESASGNYSLARRYTDHGVTGITFSVRSAKARRNGG